MGSNRKCGRNPGRDARGCFAVGNPGTAKGTRHRATRLVGEAIDGAADKLVDRPVKLALDGDPAAMKLATDRLVPPRRDAPVAFRRPRMQEAGGATKAMCTNVGAVASGELTPGEGERHARLLEAFRKTIATEDLESRIAVLEAGAGGRRQARTRVTAVQGGSHSLSERHVRGASGRGPCCGGNAREGTAWHPRHPHRRSRARSLRRATTSGPMTAVRFGVCDWPSCGRSRLWGIDR